MSASDRIAVLFEADSFSRLQDSVVVVQAALGPTVTIHAMVPVHLIEDLARVSVEWGSIDLVPVSAPIGVVRAAISMPYVLVVPPTSPLILSGVHAARAILDADPTIDEVGGLVLEPSCRIVSGAFVEIDRDQEGGVAIAPIELMDPVWSKEGGGAVTPAALLGGLTLVRAEQLRDGHIHGGSVLARALANVRADEPGQRLVYSGMSLLTRAGIDVVFPDSGEVEWLPEGAVDAWCARGIREARVLHRGLALRDDDAPHVVLVADNRVAAVDGRGDRSPEDPGSYYLTLNSRRQLGPGFESLLHLLMSLEGEAPSSSTVMVQPTTAELRLLSRARRIAAALPRPLLALAKRVVHVVGRP